MADRKYVKAKQSSSRFCDGWAIAAFLKRELHLLKFCLRRGCLWWAKQLDLEPNRPGAPAIVEFGMRDIDIDIATSFEGADLAHRIALCRGFAAQAQRLADSTVNPDARTDYLNLKQQWNLLADEMEAAAGDNLPKVSWQFADDGGDPRVSLKRSD